MAISPNLPPDVARALGTVLRFASTNVMLEEDVRVLQRWLDGKPRRALREGDDLLVGEPPWRQW